MRRTRLALLLWFLAGAFVLGSPIGQDSNASPRSLLLIIVDTLRFDAGQLHSKQVEPAIPPSLRQRGSHFTQAISAAPWTVPSIAALLTGYYPSESGIVTIGDTPRLKGPSLAERLRDLGFRTVAVVSNPTLARKGEPLYIGFDTIDAEATETRPGLGFKIRSAQKTTDAALSHLELLHRGSSPWFLLVHYFEPHGPYFSPPEYLSSGGHSGRPLPRAKTNFAGRGQIPLYQFNPRLRGRNDYIARYRASAQYAIAQVERLLKAGYESGDLDRTVVVFTADHGDLLGEQNYWFEHGITIDPSLVHVPLVIAKGAADPFTQEERPVSNLDVFSTLCGVFGAGGCSQTRGENLYELPAARRFPIVSEQGLVPGPGFAPHVAVVVDDDLLVGSPAGAPRTFHLAAREASEPSDVQIRFAKRVIHDHLLFIHAVARHPGPPDPELVKKLRALGYL